LRRPVKAGPTLGRLMTLLRLPSRRLMIPALLSNYQRAAEIESDLVSGEVCLKLRLR